MLAPPHLDVLAQPRLLGDRRRRVRLGRERRLRRRRPRHRGVVWRHHHLSSPDLAQHAVVCEGRVQEDQRYHDRGRHREWAEEHDARTERKRSEKHGWFCQMPSSVLTRLPFHTGMRYWFTPPTRFESSCLSSTFCTTNVHALVRTSQLSIIFSCLLQAHVPGAA